MGTFIGHISPGLAFFSFAIFYAFRFSWMVIKRERTQYKANKRPPGLRAALRHIPPEGVLKVIYGTLAVMAEFFYPPGVNKFYFYDRDDPKLRFQHPSEWQHVTMYGYFAFSGWLDIVSQACLPKRLILLEQAAITMAFYITTLLLKFHMHGKDELENQVHSLLLMTCFFTSLILTVELWKPNFRRLWFAKTFLVMVQGTWLLHAAFILYRPPSGLPWESSDMANLMYLTNFYCWHLAVDAALLTAIFGFAKVLHRVMQGELPQQRARNGVSKGLYTLGWNGLGKAPEELEKLTLQDVEDKEKGLQEEFL
ncbi:transmembrane epididymal protein 1-like [Ambystoma mexicanum]|uniref:transmembrane epididymal protein 1-like n=1 Tax=Ambystoma mexicanum TaxID=8296 RepID=UPI0037E6F9DF